MLSSFAGLTTGVKIALAAGVAFLVSARSELSVIDLSTSELAPLLVQISGALVALAWPAAQMSAQSVENASTLLQDVVRSEGRDADFKWIENEFEKLRSTMAPGKGGVQASLLAFAFALLAILAPTASLIEGQIRLSWNDMFCGLSLACLLTGILNFMPPVLNALELTSLKRAIQAAKTLRAGVAGEPDPAPEERRSLMSVTIVNDYDFKPEGDVAEAKAAAKELLAHFTAEVPEVQLSLWLEDRDNPLHHYHITVFDSMEAVEKVKTSPEIDRFGERLFPHIARSTYIAPVTDVWLAGGKGVEAVET